MLPIFSKSKKLLRMAVAFLLPPLMATSCQMVSDDYDCETDKEKATQYINVTISVSASDSPITRANPTGGEYGDGLEKGSTRENEVNNVTLIFYQDANGINTASDDTKVLCVKTYDVHPFTSGDKPDTHTHKPTETDDVKDNEVLYTTGDKKLGETLLQAGQSYKVLVLANSNVIVSVGEKIKDVREKVTESVYSGTGAGINATSFLMASESDATVQLTNPTVYSSMGDNRYVYYFECIHIERLAARIDFLADKSNGYKTATDNAAYTTPGYEYTVVKESDNSDSGDRFVLTSITPFNLNDGDEYLIKRTNNATNPYLADETYNNWVMDPYTTGKTSTTTHPTYLTATLTNVVANFSNGRPVTMAGEQANKLSIGSGSDAKDNIIVGYAKENTLSGGVSPLYYYATGLAFEGYYYTNGTGTGERKVYYYFIRHQGDQNTAYDAYTEEDIDDAKTTVCPTTTAMNFGIVRNNIYRISIDRITQKEKFSLKIKVKKWDKFTHEVIYM